MQGEGSIAKVWAGVALALAVASAPGCVGPFRSPAKGTTARSFLRQIGESDDPNVRYAAYDSLRSPKVYDDDGQKAEAAKLLVANMRSGKEPTATRAVICRTLGAIGRPEARQAILAAASDEDPLVRAEACRALGRVGQPEDSTVLARVMTVDTSGECRVAAIESLGLIKAKDRRINEFLVAGMEHEDPAIRVACLHSLRAITGKDLGVDPLPWKKYIESLYPRDKPKADPDTIEAKATAPRSTRAR